VNHEELHRRIAERAYHLFIKRGGEHGRDVEDWLRAEREMLRELGSTSAAVDPAQAKKIGATTRSTSARGASSKSASSMRKRKTSA